MLYHCLRHAGRPVAGVDTFQWSSREGVLESFAQVFGSTAGLTLLAADSRALTAAQTLGALGGRKPDFISVDGDHTALAVCADIAFAESLLAPGGIVAIDDFLNWRAIGVSEGAYRYFLGTAPGLQPFCYCSNKLFAARPADCERYRGAVVAFASALPDLPMNQVFNNYWANDRTYAEQTLLGAPVLLL